MVADEREGTARSFKVVDRRLHAEEGAAADAQPATPTPTAEPPPASEPPPDTGGERVPINFATFVISLSTQALAQLGEIPHPVDGTMKTDLAGARQIIDILAMLREKTQGNLDGGESHLLDSALYDLRMKYVERTRRR
jgi:hypothetical protein